VFLDDVDPIDSDFLYYAVDIHKVLLYKNIMIAPLGVRIQVTIRANNLSSSLKPPTEQVLT